MMYAVHHFVIAGTQPGLFMLLPKAMSSFTGPVLVYLDNTKVNGI